MTKLNPEGHFLEKPSSLWLTIFAAVVSFAVALAVLQSGREVNASDIKDLKANYQTINEKLDKMNEKMTQTAVNQAEMKTDIEYIKKAVIVVQEK
jgi:mannitol-specific phosphotransferase system IIBC component